MIIFLCTTFAFGATACWVFGKNAWNATNPNDAGKAFAQEVFTTMLAQLPQFERNGSGNHTGAGSFLRLRRRRSEHDETPK